MKRNLPIKKVLVSLYALLLLVSGKVSASHTMGADLTYQCLGGNTYKVTVSFYRDCIGIAAPANPLVTINSASCGQSLSVTCYKRPGTGQEVTPACSSSVTTCNGGSFTGIQEWVYDGIVTLPAACADWTFGYSLCCRNAAITTINSPSGSTFYIYATLNNLVSTCNSSPTFSNKPVPFLCLGQQYCFNHGAYDADGDSLVYSLITPMQTSSSTVTYHAPYNASNPLNSSPSTAFNTATGDICLNPQALEVTVMAVLVKEYRNGVLIGSVERDLQLTVMNCANNLPSLSGINGTNNFSMTVCANQQTCFNIFSNDPDAGQQLSVDWNYGIPGATFSSGSGLHPTGTFCWTPGPADIGNSYTFTVRVQDDACPYYGSQVYSYTINVIGIAVNAGPDQQIACSDLATLTAHASGGSGTYTYLWSNGSTMQSITVGEGTYTVTANDGSCSATDTVVVTLPFIPTAAFTHSPVLCLNNPIQFTDQSTTPAGIFTSYLWDFGDGATSALQNPSHQFPSAGTYIVSLIVENNLGCLDTVTHTVVIANPPVSAFTATNSCINSSVSFTDQTTGNANYWHWYFGDGATSFAHNPTHTYTSAGTFNVTLISGDTLGCLDTVTHPITIFSLPIVSAGTDQNICSGGSITLTATGGVTYVWNPSGSTGSTITLNPSGSTTISVTGTDANGCSAIDTVSIAVNPLPNINAGADAFICAGGSVTLNASGGISYVWMPGGYSGPNYTVDPAITTSYTVIGTGANGCTASDVVNVNVGALPVVTITPDVNICAGQSATLTAGGGVTYSWNPIGSTTSTVTVSPTDTTQYEVIATDAAGCTSNAYVSVNVNPLPVVNLQSFFLCAGSTTTLNAGNPGSTYSWNTGATTQTISISSGGNYNVTVTSPYGCVASSACNIAYGTALTINLANVSFCQGDSAVLDAGYPGMTYAWTPSGQTTQSIVVNTPGSYGVTVTDSLGCSGSINVTAVMNALPVTNFSATSVCQGATTAFTDGSSTTSGSISNWNWSFGDGANSTAQNPTHAYATAGTYNVSLTTTTTNGCTSTITRSVTVNPLPVASFTGVDGCQGSNISFTNTSTVSSGFINTFAWTFGDGATSSSANPTHTYATAGNYVVNLQVTTAGGCSANINGNLTVHPLPVAAFSAPAACLGNATAFTNTSTISTGSISTTNWNFHDSYTSNQNSPSHAFATAGSHNVTLIVNSALGCSDTISQTIVVNALPLANAGADRTVCNGITVNLTATGGTTYNWMPGNLNSASITVSPASTTNYTVQVTDANGCSATDNAIVNVNPLPTANAGANQAICTGAAATLSGSGGLTYSWSPGSATSASITVNPTSTTNYTLTVTDANGCQDTAQVRVTVNPLPVVSAGPDQTICNGSIVSFTASGASTYQWNPIGSTSQTVLVTPSTNSTYIVIGTDINGCVSRDTVSAFVFAVPVVSLNPTFICQGYSTTLDAGNPGSTYDWSTGETSQTISVSDSGTYSVVVTSANGCAALAQTVVTVGGNITANPTTVNICSGLTTTLNAGNPGSTYAWSTGATTQTITTGTSGNYYVTITDPNGCSATKLNIVNVDPLPVASFSTSPSCMGDATAFTNTTSIASGSINSSLWSFGDSFSSSNNSPSHQYSADGTYSATLTVTSAAGCTSTITQNVVIHPLPVADFVTTNVCLGMSNQFTDNSTVSSGSISEWIWNYGDGANGSGASSNHTYSTPGSYNVTLIAVTANNCRDTISHAVVVNGLPVANFSGPNACAESLVNFNNTSASSYGAITSYEWNFANGNTSSVENPSMQFNNPGNYNVSLIVTSALGCSDTLIQPITIFPVPVAAITTTNACTGTAIGIANNSTVVTGTIQNYYWTFGDNTTSNDILPSHAYSNAGSYPVNLVVTSDHGCRDTATATAVAHPLPVVNMTTESVCLGVDVDFLNASTSSSGGVTTWAWTFGDGSTSNAFQPSHTYSSAGNYSVQLTATSNYGCTASTFSSLNIYPNPVASFSVSDICLGGANQLVNQSSVDGGISFTSNWSFDDGTFDSNTNPAHTFAAAGAYNISLTVTTPNGCTAQASNNLRVFNPPVALFSGTNECDGVSTKFIDQSYSQDGNIVGWLWNFGDNGGSVEGNPGHLYSDPNTYNVSLTVTSVYGCFDSYNDSVQVYARPRAEIYAASACQGSPVQFANVSSSSGQISYQWDLGNGFTSTDSSFSYTFGSAGFYDVTLVAIDTNNCATTELARVEVYPKPTPNFSSTEACLNSPTEFRNQSFVTSGSTIAAYIWNFGDQSNSNQTNPYHTYSQVGIYNISLTAITNYGCQETTVLQARVNPNPVAMFASGGSGCGPITSTFTESASISEGSITGWLWNFSDGEISTDRNPSHIFTNSGNYDVNLTVVSDRGCYATYTASNVIQVYPSPTADFTASTYTTDILNPTVNFQNQSTNYTAYQWIFGDGTSTSTILNPTHTFSDTGSYTALLITTNNYGCKDTILKHIEIRPKSTLFVPNCFTPNGDGKNEVFRPYHTNMEHLQVWVYDRWGVLLKTWDTLDGSWDGYYQGKKCQQDTYVYKIIGDGIDGQHSEWVGHVSIVY